MATPSAELVDAYLTEIAKAYRVDKFLANLEPDGGGNKDDDSEGGTKVIRSSRSSPMHESPHD
jgi:hypothetical protein